MSAAESSARGAGSPLVVMGVSGSGKSTMALLLAERLGARFVDADDLHPPENVAMMAAGRPLGDAERLPWLHAVGRALAGDGNEGAEADASPPGGGVVVACSALKRGYRDILRGHAPGTRFVFLDGSRDLIAERIGRRNHEFMPKTLLASQFETLEPLEPDEPGLRVDIGAPPESLARTIAAALTP